MTKKTKIDAPLVRTLSLRAEGIIDEEERLIEVSVSSEQSVKRVSWEIGEFEEVLGHGADEVDLSRLNSNAPVLYNHNRFDSKDRIGVVVKAWIENGRVMAHLKLSKRDEVSGIWQDVKDRILCNVSAGYRVHEMMLSEDPEDGLPVYRVTKWELLEVSLVDVPADATVGIGRADEKAAYEQAVVVNPSGKTEKRTEQEVMDKTKDDAPKAEAAEVDVASVRKEALEAEAKRRAAIREVFTPFGETHRGLQDECLDDVNVDVAAARERLLKKIGEDKTAIAPAADVRLVKDERDKFRAAVGSALQVRAGVEQGTPGENEFAGYTLQEIARKSLELAGEDTRRMDKMTMVGRAFTHSSSDFPAILSNVAHRSMLRGYEEVEESFEAFTRAGNLSDFKLHERAAMSEFSDLEKVPENAEYKHGTFGDHKALIKLDTFGRLFSISRQAIINDDLDAFTRIPLKMGQAAKRKIGDLVYGVLIDNPTMADGTALFHADHGNLLTGAAPSVAALDKLRQAMRLQKGLLGEANLNISPATIICPVALEGQIRQIITSETDVSKSNSKAANYVRDMANVVSDARLDAADAAAWYGAADPVRHDVIEVGYLDGNPQPTMEEEEGFSVDGVKYKVRIDAAVAALDHRTLQKNPGAS